jgi:hypothetical protein
LKFSVKIKFLADDAKVLSGIHSKIMHQLKELEIQGKEVYSNNFQKAQDTLKEIQRDILLIKERKLENLSHTEQEGPKGEIVNISEQKITARDQSKLARDDENPEKKLPDLFLCKIKRLISDSNIPLKDNCLRQGANDVSFRSWGYFFRILKFLLGNEVTKNPNFNSFLEDSQAVKAFSNFAYHDLKRGNEASFLDPFKLTEHDDWEHTTFYRGNSKATFVSHLAW